MSIRNETLYDALSNIGSTAAIVESERKSLENCLERLEKAKRAAEEVIKQMSPEQIRELAELPIKSGDVLLHIEYDPNTQEVLIKEEAEQRHRGLYELLPEETPEQKSARLQRIREAAGKRANKTDQEA